MKIDIDMIGLTTKDMAASIRFYRTLGLDIAEPAEGEDYHETKLPSGVRLSWNTVELVKQLDPDWIEPLGQRVGIAFLCESPSEVNNVYDRLVQAGYRGKNAPFDAFWGQRYAVVIDPDGGAVDLFAPLG